MKENVQIGIASIFYNEDGSPSKSEFVPLLRLIFPIQQLSSIRCAEPDVVKNNAEAVVAAWFELVNKIELADREDYFVDSETMDCQTYSNGKVKSTKIKFWFKKRTS